MSDNALLQQFESALSDSEILHDVSTLLLEWAEKAVSPVNVDVLRLAGQRLLAAGEAESNADWKRSAFRYLGIAERFSADYDSAMQHNQQALELCTADDHQLDAGRLHQSIAAIHVARHDHAQAFENYHNALKKFEEVGDSDRATDVTVSIGLLHWQRGEYTESMDHARRTLLYYEQKSDEVNIAGCLRSVGLTYFRLGELNQALDFLSRALQLYEKLGRADQIAGDFQNIGNIHKALGNYDKALEYYNSALTINRAHGNKTWENANLQGIGHAYQKQGDLDKAFDVTRRAISNLQTIADQGVMEVVVCQAGCILEEMGDYDHALEYFDRSRALSLQRNSKFSAVVALLNIGGVFANPKYAGYDAAKAEETLLQCVETLDEAGVKAHLFQAYETLYKLYSNEQRWEEALEYHEKFIHLRDEVQSEDARLKAVQTEHLRRIAEREKEIAIAHAAASAELTATTHLLHKVLPQTIADRLVKGEEEIADYFPTVSILFADIAGFTPLSAEMPAYIVVRFLNFVFREFDRIIKKHGCEKIKTIGDGYMAVAGAPVECADHAERIVAAAIEMQEVITLPDEIRGYIPQGTKFGVRIGLHTGSVVAGVIGEERFVYDIYSDAVNTAARMESHGKPNKIHVTSEFVRHLQNRFAMAKSTSHGITFTKRDEMEIKGKGKMRTYFLERT